MTLPDSLFEGPPQELINDRPGGEPVTERRRRHGRKRPAADKRLDIQGLRAVAVVAVVVNHLTGHPVGGFVGVDVFFVISGYLITGLLVRDLGPRPDAKLAGPLGYVWAFYKRRIRRILPAAVLVIGLTLIAAHVAFNSARYASTQKDGLWSLVFWANWHFISVGTDYFTASGPTSPFQHYWSLAVEEQFYLVWPIAIFLIAAAVRQRRSLPGRRAVVGAAALLLTGGSFWFALTQSHDDPTRAYFSAITRGWELGLGALLAVLVPLVRAPRWLLSITSLTGLALIAVSLFTTHGGVGFPAPGAVLACAGSGLVIAATSRGRAAWNPLLTNRLAVYLGDISYSVYLIHFPVIILLAVYLPTGAYYYGTAVALTLGLSSGLYGLVERPILNSGFLRSRSGSPERDAAADDPISSRGFGLIALTCLVVAGLLVVAWPGRQQAQGREEARISSALKSGSPQPPAPKVKPTPAADHLNSQIRAALLATQWPKLSPSMDDVIGGYDVPVKVEPCGTTFKPASRCTWGDRSASHTIYLVGDSTSMAYVAGFQAMVKHLPDWKVRVAGGFGCNFANQLLTQTAGNPYAAGCPQRQRDVLANIRETRPDVLVVTNSTARTGVVRPIDAEVKAAAGSVGKVVILPAAPVIQDPKVCYTPGSVPSDCAVSVPTDYLTDLTAEKQISQSVPNGVFVDPLRWFCASGYCPAFAGPTPTHFDALHISPAYSARLAPVMKEALSNARALGR